MTTILEIREKIKIIYGRYSLYILPVIKFFFALMVFMSVNKTLGFMEVLKNPFVVIILSLICAIMPTSTTTAVAGLMIIGHCYSLGIEVAAFAIVLFLIMTILYFRFAPGSSFALLITPLAFGLNVPCVVPIGYGLLKNPSSAISVANGVIVYYFMTFVGAQANVLQAKGITELPNKLKLLIDGIVKNQNILVGVIACITVVLLVYVIRRLSVQYAWRIAIFVGAIAFLIIQIGASFFLNTDGVILGVILGSIGAIIISFILEFFFFHVDYTRTEQLQFEDDEYYYYIKAVPKVSITTPERDIRNISKEPEMKEHSLKSQVRKNNSNEDRVEKVETTYDVNQFTGEKRNPFMDSDVEFLSEVNKGYESIDVDAYEDVDFEKKLEESLKNL